MSYDASDAADSAPSIFGSPEVDGEPSPPAVQAGAAPSAPATRLVQRGEQVYSMRVPARDPVSANPDAARKVQRVPDPEPFDDDDVRTDPVAELERATRRIDELEAQVAALTATDRDREVVRLSGLVARLNARLDGVNTTLAEATSDVRWQRRILDEARRLLGVQQFREIVPTLRRLVSGDVEAA